MEFNKNNTSISLNESLLNCIDLHRFGFNGKEKDDEITGSTGSHLNFKYRMYDSRIGRFFAVDPLTAKYPWNSPYAFSENRVIDAIEFEGLESVNLSSPDDKLLWQAAEANKDESALHIYAHAWTDWLRDNSPESPIDEEGKGAKIITGQDLDEALERQNISREGKTLIVLHSCHSTKVAKSISESEGYENVYIAAPVENLSIVRTKEKELGGGAYMFNYSENTYIPEKDDQGNRIRDDEGNVVRTDEKANWQIYKGGEVIYEGPLNDFKYSGFEME